MFSVSPALFLRGFFFVKTRPPPYFLRVPAIVGLGSARFRLRSLVRVCFEFCLGVKARNAMLEEIVNRDLGSCFVLRASVDR